MTHRTSMKWSNCADCKAALTESTFWLDDSGALCRECALRKRVDRIRRNHAATVRQGLAGPRGPS